MRTGRRHPRVRRRAFDPADDRGSMAVLLMVVLVGMMLSAMVVPMIISTDRTTRFDTTRVQALDAAQAGLDVVMGRIRTSTTTSADASQTVVGTSSKLPCGPMSGTVNTASAAAYSVVIEYFTLDPVAYPPSSSSNTAISCSSGGTTSTPNYARLTSTGTVGTAVNGATVGRTLTSTYGFRTVTTNVAGGTIAILPVSASLCMDAGANPAVATPITLQACSTSTPPAAQQTFVYRNDLTLQLLSSVTSSNTNGLCIAPAASPPAAGNAVQLGQCGVLGTPPYAQQWSFQDNGHYQDANSTSATTGSLPDLCINASASAGQPLTVASSCDSTLTWAPSSAIGAGAAALPQWVNYQEFGRCLDIAYQNINTDHLFDYPCKQNPFPGALTWNQLLQAPVIPTGQQSVTAPMYTTVSTGGTQYCLTSPGTDGGYVTMTTCASGTSSQQWTMYGGDKSLPYSSKYQIVNGTLCLGLTTPYGNEVWSALVVEKCTGATDQKWNGAASVLNSTVSNTKEK